MNIINLLFFIIFAYLGTLAAKFFFFIINKYDFYSIFKEDYITSFRKYLFIPFFNFNISSSLLLDKKVRKKKFQNLLKLSLISEILGAVSLGIFSFSIINIFTSFSGFSSIIYIIIIAGFTLALLYLAIYDIITFSIPENFIKLLSLIAIGANLLIGLSKIIFANLGFSVFSSVPLGAIGNLFSGVIFALFIWLLVKISKEKAMGEGDIYLVLVIGLILGWPGTLISFLTTLVLGSIISLFVAWYFKRFKDLLVPFVPFLLLGFVVALSFGVEIYSKIFFI